MANTKNNKRLHIFGDSKLVVDWVCGHVGIVAYSLEHVLHNIKFVMSYMEWFSYYHTYMELNMKEY